MFAKSYYIQNTTFDQGPNCLLDETFMKAIIRDRYNLNFEIPNCDPLKYTMEESILIVSISVQERLTVNVQAWK